MTSEIFEPCRCQGTDTSVTLMPASASAEVAARTASSTSGSDSGSPNPSRSTPTPPPDAQPGRALGQGPDVVGDVDGGRLPGVVAVHAGHDGEHQGGVADG